MAHVFYGSRTNEVNAVFIKRWHGEASRNYAYYPLACANQHQCSLNHV